jgi:hypothetical protein
MNIDCSDGDPELKEMLTSNTISIAVSFDGNVGTSIAFCEKTLPIQTQLVFRILYSYFGLAQAIDWISFTTWAISTSLIASLQLNQTLEVVAYHSKLHNPHIFLAIDEPIKTENAQQILDSMSELLNQRPAPWKYFSCLLTSLSHLPLANYDSIKSSGRSVYCIPLNPFDMNSTKRLFRSVIPTWPPQFKPALNRLAFDCGGNAQTIQVMTEIIRKNFGALNHDATEFYKVCIRNAANSTVLRLQSPSFESLQACLLNRNLPIDSKLGDFTVREQIQSGLLMNSPSEKGVVPIMHTPLQMFIHAMKNPTSPYAKGLNSMFIAENDNWNYNDTYFRRFHLGWEVAIRNIMPFSNTFQLRDIYPNAIMTEKLQKLDFINHLPIELVQVDSLSDAYKLLQQEQPQQQRCTKIFRFSQENLGFDGFMLLVTKDGEFYTLNFKIKSKVNRSVLDKEKAAFTEEYSKFLLENPSSKFFPKSVDQCLQLFVIQNRFSSFRPDERTLLVNVGGLYSPAFKYRPYFQKMFVK